MGTSMSKASLLIPMRSDLAIQYMLTTPRLLTLKILYGNKLIENHI